MKSPRVLVLGTGAIGSLYGGLLQQAGAEVSVVCRSDYDHVSADGIAVSSVFGDFHFHPSAVLRQASDSSTPPDYLLVALKVLPEIDTVALLHEAVGPETAIVLLQNGVEIESPVVDAFPDNEVISGLAFVCCNRVAPGRIHHLDYGRITLGSYPKGVSHRAKSLGDLYASVKVPCVLSDDIVTARWHKLVWNAPFNPISVVAGGVDTAQMLAAPACAALVKAVMEEVCEIAAGVGHPLPDSIVADMLGATRQMAPYKTSMLLDYEAGRPMESEAILGNAVRAADRCGVGAPNLRTVYALLDLANRSNHAPSS